MLVFYPRRKHQSFYKRVHAYYSGRVNSFLFAATILSFGSVAMEQPGERKDFLLNPGFESSTLDGRGIPSNWLPITADTTITLDRTIKSNGDSSAKVLAKSGARFAGIYQRIDATALQGKVIKFSAKLRCTNLGDGTPGVWVRTEGPNSATPEVSFQDPVKCDGNWVARSVTVAIGDQTVAILLGTVLNTSGEFWADDTTLSTVNEANSSPISANAEKYFGTALEKIKATSLNSSKVDWVKTERIARLLASGAQVSSDTYQAIRYAIRVLDDGHSFFGAPSPTRAHKNTPQPDYSQQFMAKLVGNVGYVAIPAFVSESVEQNRFFVETAHVELARIQKEKPCAWIVDLRKNRGGDLYPMIASLGPFFGDGKLGTFGGKGYGWSLKSGAVWTQSEVIAPKQPFQFRELEKTPVAVLIGAATASSGEATLISFIGRDNTRTFGQPTAGLSTANERIALDDGAILAIASAPFVDRNGVIYGGKIPPDELVPQAPPRTNSGEAKDTTLAAALVWLTTTNSCMSPRRN